MLGGITGDRLAAVELAEELLESEQNRPEERERPHRDADPTKLGRGGRDQSHADQGQDREEDGASADPQFVTALIGR